MHVVKKTDKCRWYAGYGADQYIYFAQEGPKKFLGGTYVVESYADLEKCVPSFPRTNDIEIPAANQVNGLERLSFLEPERSSCLRTHRAAARCLN